MKRIWRIVAWMVAGSFALIASAIVAALVFTRTAQFNEFLRIQIVRYLAQTYRGQITIAGIEGSVWGSLTLRDVEVHHGGKIIASVPQLRVGYLILPALRNQIVISEINVLNPELHLIRDPDGQWNLLAAIAKRSPSPASRSTLTIALRSFSIDQAQVVVATAPSVTYRLADGNIRGTAEIGLSEQSVTVHAISFSLNGPRMPAIRAYGAAEYNEAAQVAAIRVPRFAVRTARSQVAFGGTLRDLSERNVDATISVRRLAAADLNSLAPQVKLAHDLSGTIRIKGKAADLHTEMALALGDARIEADVQADVASSEPVWKIDSHLIRIDLRKLLKTADPQQLPAGQIDATIHANGLGASPAAAKGELGARVAGLGDRGVFLGDLTLSAAVAHQTANLNALLAGPGGRAQLVGRIYIVKTPNYNLALELHHLRPASVAKTAIPPADLNLTAAIDGSGYDPETMRLHTQVRLQPSTIRAIRIDSGRLEAQLSAGIVRITTASLRAGETRVDLKGQLAVDSRRSGSLNYNLTVGQVSQWLALAGRHGSGRVDLAGQAHGSLKALRTSGFAELSALHLDTWSVAGARLTYDIGGLGTPFEPAGQASLMANDLHAGVELKTLQTAVRLNQGTALNAAVNLRAEDRLSHPAAMRADIAYKPGLIVVNLSEMALATGHGSWQLIAPAQVTLRGSAVEVRRLAAANQGQSIVLGGTVSRTGPQNVTLQLEQLRLTDFAGFLPPQVKIAGLATTQLTVRGTAAAPIIAMSGGISQLRLADIPNAGMSMGLSYANGHAQAEMTLSQDTTHSLSASASLPLALGWARGFEARPTGDADLRAVSNGLNLAVLNAFVSKQLSGVGGTLSLDVAAHGPLRHPVPHGFIRLSGLHASARPLKVDFTGGSADIEFEPGAVRLVSLSAKAGNGTMTGGGALTLKPNGAPDHVDANVVLDQWPAIATHEYTAMIAARLSATGPLSAMQVGGRIEVLQGVVRPNLSLTGSAPHPDETLTVVHYWGQPPPVLRSQAPSTTGASPTYRSLALDMELVINRNTWIKAADFAVELQGNLHAHKPSASAKQPDISGTINTVRGTLVVAGRQFDLSRGQIMFTGGLQVNPELSIVAQYRVQKYTISASVAGTATKPTLTLSSIPDLQQADILSVLMFGKPSNELSGGQQKDLQNQALSMAGSYAAAQAGQAIAESLGLSELGVTTTSAGVGLGRYLSKNVYVSASQSTSEMQNRQAEIQYYLTPSVTINTSASTNYGNEIRLQWHKNY